MEKYKEIIQHLKRLPPDFFGQIIIRFRQGKAVLLEENRTVKLDDKKR